MKTMRTFFLGHFAPRIWQRLCLLIIVQFLGMLMLAWWYRSPEVAASTPFRNVISSLGKGRMDGNFGAWIFLCCFCIFALLLIPWHLHLARRVSSANRIAARALGVVGVISLIGVAFVGIFDEHAMGPVSRDLSRAMHGFGAASAFGGHCVGAFLSWYLFASIYARSSEERRRTMPHPGKLLVSVLALVAPLIFVCLLLNPTGGRVLIDYAGGPAPEIVWRVPFWQWSLMLSLMGWLYCMSRWYPDSLVEDVENTGD